MLVLGEFDPQSEMPLYRQIYGKIRHLIETGEAADGERLPPTRELAGSLGLNRTTIAAAYELLEAEGFLRGHVGRGSFVHRPRTVASVPARISFATSRPSEQLFPLAEFRESCAEVIQSDQAQTILQLGSPSGYAPLREFLLDRAEQEGAARETDDILITSGCQQAFDLLERTLAHNETVLIEDPVIPGLRQAFERGGARVIGVPVGAEGIELEPLERIARRERPKLIVITPNYQNPTGATLPLEGRIGLIRIAHELGVTLVENDIYGELGYEGEPLPTLKRLDSHGETILLRSFSKLAFPGLRVGWAIGPRQLIARLTEAKQWTDLHTDQLSQAVLLRFAESGRLERHRRKIVEAGRARLRATIASLERHLPPGSDFTRPSGGMNLWVRLPAPLDAGELLARAEREGISYLPGRFFGVSKIERGGLRISFAGLTPAQIETGIAVLGRIFRDELGAGYLAGRAEAVPAMV